MPTPEDLAEGAIYIARKHKRDLGDLAVWVGLFVVCAGVSWLVLHAVLLVHTPHAIPTCQSVQQCQNWIIHHPLHVKPMPGFPQFHGPTFGNTP